jgi:vacuolar-type H+-ATPase subunit I/STV1
VADGSEFAEKPGSQVRLRFRPESAAQIEQDNALRRRTQQRSRYEARIKAPAEETTNTFVPSEHDVGDFVDLSAKTTYRTI